MALTSFGIGSPVGLLLSIVATAGPSIAAVALASILGRAELRELLAGFSISRLSARWAALAVALPLAMIAVAIAVAVAFLGSPSPTLTLGVVGVLLVEFVRVLFLGGPLEEELGWRGFALPRLQGRLAALEASILLGVIWGLWHIPLYFVPGTGQFETIAAGTDPAFAIGGFIGWTIGLSVLFTWLFNQTRASLLVVMLFHAAVNLGAFLPSAVGSAGAASLLYVVVTWLVAAVVAIRFGRRTLAL